MCKVICRLLAVLLASMVGLWFFYKDEVKAVLYELNKAPRDDAIGNVPVLTPEDLTPFYKSKRCLVVGGTRGVGRGTALALAQAGAWVTVVGRNSQSGNRVVTEMKQAALQARSGRNGQEVRQEVLQGTFRSGHFRYLRGDLASARTSLELVQNLTEIAEKEGKFDYLVVSAAMFPDWKDLRQEDGLEKGFAVAVLGRFALYKYVDKFMHTGPSHRVLNILASGMKPMSFMNRTLITGPANPTNLFEAIWQWGWANEMMQVGLEKKKSDFGLTRVSTHPGLLVTDLHRGQGLWFDVLETVAYALMGITEEDCGLRQATILASPKLHKGKLSYVDEHMIGRKLDPSFEIEINNHLGWLWKFLNYKLEDAEKAMKNASPTAKPAAPVDKKEKETAPEAQTASA
eukprot:g79723.t1